MIPKPSSCAGCPILDNGEGFVPAQTDGTNGVLLVFEAAGEQEEKKGKPMVGKAGFAFNKMLRHGGMKREDFNIHNVLSCRPPHNQLVGTSYALESIAHCAPNLNRTIADTHPRCIVAGGAVALERLTGIQGILRARGYVHTSLHRAIPTVATYHPSYIMRGNANLSQAFIYDLQHAVEIAQNGFTYDDPTYTLDPLLHQAERWGDSYLDALQRNPSLPLAYDIETPYKGSDESTTNSEDDPTFTILRISFSMGSGCTISVPWRTEFLPFIQRVLHSSGDKLVWNSHYDTPRIKYNQIEISGVIHDAMVAWHVLNSDLPKSLEFVTPFFCPSFPMWKHLNKQKPAWYNAADSDTLWRNYAGTEQELKRTGLWSVYESHVLRLDPVLAYMSQQGMPIDNAKREYFARELSVKMDTVLEDIRSHVPLSIQKVEPKNGYVKKPADTSGMARISIEATETYCPKCGERNPKKPHFRALKTKKRPCAGLSPLPRDVTIERWAKVIPFKPSSTQLFAYQEALGHKFMYNGYGSKRRRTTDEKAIVKLMNAHPKDLVYPKVLEYRELVKVGGTYIGYPND